MRLTVRARELSAGDVLLGSRQIVVRVSHPSYRGSTWLHLRTRSGRERSASFNAQTTITIERPDRTSTSSGVT